MSSPRPPQASPDGWVDPPGADGEPTDQRARPDRSAGRTGGGSARRGWFRPLAILAAVAAGALVIALAVGSWRGGGDDGSADSGTSSTEADEGRGDPRPPDPTAVPPRPPASDTGAPTTEVDLTQGELAAGLMSGGTLGLEDADGAASHLLDVSDLEGLEADAACLDLLDELGDDGIRPRFGGGQPEAPRRAAATLSADGATVVQELTVGVGGSLADQRRLVLTCPRIAGSLDGREIVLTSRLAEPFPVGDVSLAVEYEVDDGGPRPTTVRWLLWDRGPISASLSVSGSEATDLFLLQALAQAGDTRLVEVIDG